MLSFQYRVQLYWNHRAESTAQMADAVWRFVTSLGQLSPKLAALRPFTREGELLPPLEGPQHAEALLSHWQLQWNTGDTEHTSYKPGFVLERLDDPPLQIEFALGMPDLGMDGVWIPNRLEVLVEADAGREIVSTEVLVGILHVAVRVFQPDWGFVGREGCPVAPPPLFSQGQPVAAWVTYLSKRFPVEEMTVQEPSAIYEVGDFGYLVMAHPVISVPWSRSQPKAVAAVDAAMRAAGVMDAERSSDGGQ